MSNLLPQNDVTSTPDKDFFEASADDFIQIPGSPIVYWLSDAMRKTFHSGTVSALFFSDGLTKTGNNLRYLRYWWELSKSMVENRDWYRFCAKGGDERSFYGNLDYVIRWDEKTRLHYKQDSVARLSPEYLWNREGITWTKISSKGGTFRLLRQGDVAETGGPSLFLKDSVPQRTLRTFLGILSSTVVPALLQGLNPTLNYQTGDVLRIPVPKENCPDIQPEIVSKIIDVSRSDWDSYETSWDFRQLLTLTALRVNSQAEKICQIENRSLANIVSNYIEQCKTISATQLQREISNNKLVADAYGLSDEVKCDVPIEDVSLKRNPAFAYPGEVPAERDELFARDIIKEIISYAVGCMFGRYSLDKPGLILASQGETLDDYYAQIPNPNFEPDKDNVIPVTEVDCFEDDVVSRFRKFLEITLGKENLAENIAYIQSVLGKDLRKYFVNDFYNDHVRMYKNRPIYWQYSSRTDNKGSFKALIYLHRYTTKTNSTVLGYLRDYTSRITGIAEQLEKSDRAQDKRSSEKLRKAIAECKTYEDQTLYPLATRNLEIDFDDGVLVNYLRLGKALREIPAIEKKRKDVESWTWPHFPLTH